MISLVRKLGQRLQASNYVRAISKLTGGQMAASVPPLLAAPLLGRLYTPADYGALALVMALTGPIGALATLQFQNAILAERSERRAHGIVYLCLRLAVAAAILSGVVGVAVAALVGPSSEFRPYRAWMLILPLTTLASGVAVAVSSFANRHKQYGTLAMNAMIAVGISVPTSIMLGLFGWGGHGLLVSHFLGQMVATAALVRLYVRMRAHVPAPAGHWLHLAYRHRNFPRYGLLANLISVVNLNAPVYVLSSIGATTLLGSYSRAVRLTAAPATLIGRASATVFFQRGASDYREHGSCRPILLRTAACMLALIALPTLLLVGYGKEIFLFVLGPNWGGAGEIAPIIAPMIALLVMTTPVMSVFQFTGRQHVALVVQVVTAVTVAIAIGLPIYFSLEPVNIIINYAIGYSLVCVMIMALAVRLADVPLASARR